jgi:hypothetical protein
MISLIYRVVKFLGTESRLMVARDLGKGRDLFNGYKVLVLLWRGENVPWMDGGHGCTIV